MNLNTNTLGDGPDLVVLHGWALHSGVFDGIAEILAKKYRVHLIDLPGHGHNASLGLPSNVEQLARMLLDAAPEKARWLGWSLGGMASMAAAIAAPERVERLITVAATPRFVASSDWPHAIPVETLNGMAVDLNADFRKTVQNFLSLQVLGDERAQAMLRDLRARLYAHGEPAEIGLANGLRILHDTDLREAVRDVSVPWLSLMGQRDRLASPKTGEWIEANVKSARNVTIAKAAHAPFISHREEFLAAVFEFLEATE